MKSLVGSLRVLSSLLYINDINKASNLLNLIFFADNTNVFMSHKDMYLHSAELNVVAVTENVNTFLLV